MYYHGTKYCVASPYANKNEYSFWVYPQNRNLGSNKWDTHLPVSLYCNNHIEGNYDECGGVNPDQTLKKYICLGHNSIQDMKVAQDEWKSNNASVFIEQNGGIGPYFPNKNYVELEDFIKRTQSEAAIAKAEDRVSNANKPERISMTNHIVLSIFAILGILYAIYNYYLSAQVYSNEIILSSRELDL